MELKVREQIKGLGTIEQILYSRGFYTTKEMDLFLHPSSSAEHPYIQLDHVESAARRILRALVRQEQVYIQVDSDCDGYTSAALLLNYCHKIAPSVVENKWDYALHSAKVHGIDIDKATEKIYDLIIAPDSSSNEKGKHKSLIDHDISVIVLDHHEAENYEDDPALIVNNQLCAYPNKFLSGVGIVYKLCQCIDHIASVNYADNYLDLVALGLLGDMMDMRELETRYYITEGLECVTNPFFKYLAEKNSYSMNGQFNPHTVSWYIAPFINAVTRVGNDYDKQLVFESMLDWKAGELIKSDKRGAAIGSEELRVTQAVRHSANVKRHQDENKKKLLEEIDLKLQKYPEILQAPVLIVQNKGVVDDDPIRGITGLVANSLMSKYHKPTLVLNEIMDGETGEITWSGSGRGFATTNINNWRDYIGSTGTAIFAQGHPFAFGVAFNSDGLERFKNTIESQFGTTPFIMTYDVDFIWTMNDEFDNKIMEIGEYGDIWGQGVPEPLVAIEHIKIKNDVKINLLAKGTLRIDLTPHKTSCIKFGSNVDEYESLKDQTITIVGTCSINEWNDMRSPQIQIIDYFIESVPQWDF